MANIRQIRSEEDYEAALDRISELMDADSDSPEGNELDVLVDLVELYESKHVPMGFPSPIAAIDFRMEQAGLRPEILPHSSEAVPRSRKFSPASAQSQCRWRTLCMSISEFRRECCCSRPSIIHAPPDPASEFDAMGEWSRTVQTRHLDRRLPLRKISPAGLINVANSLSC